MSWLEWLGQPAVDEYSGLKLNDLPLNHAYVISNTSLQRVGVYSVGDDCYKCPYKLIKLFEPGEETSWQFDSRVQSSWKILNMIRVPSQPEEGFQYIAHHYRQGLVCEIRPEIEEYAIYRLDNGLCKLEAEIEPAKSYFPLFLCCVALLSIYVLYRLIRNMKTRLNRNKQGANTEFEIEPEKQIILDDNKEHEKKLDGLYIFRGILICLIIFTTSGGGGYPLFNKKWGEMSLADGLFFMYAWSVGFHIPTVIEKAKTKAPNKYSIVIKIIKKASILIVLGALIELLAYITTYLYGSSEHKPVTLWWPLQLLGISYFVCSCICLITVRKFELKSKSTALNIVANAMSLSWCWIFAAVFLLMFIVSLFSLASFNCQTNNNEGLSIQKELSNVIAEVTEACANNYTKYVNRVFIAQSKDLIYINSYYGFSTGVLGFLTIILQTMIGLKAGTVYEYHKTNSDRIKLWLFWALITTITGVIFAILWWIFNFNLWPVSTIFLISSFALYYLCVIYTLNQCDQSETSILVETGKASLIILFGHLLFSSSIPFYSWPSHAHIYFLIQNFAIVFLWIVVAIILSKKNIRFHI